MGRKGAGGIGGWMGGRTARRAAGRLGGALIASRWQPSRMRGSAAWQEGTGSYRELQDRERPLVAGLTLSTNDTASLPCAPSCTPCAHPLVLAPRAPTPGPMQPAPTCREPVGCDVGAVRQAAGEQ